MTRERIGRFCIILGGLCILAAAFLLGFNLREERRAAAATQRILPAVAHSIGQSPAPMPTLPAGELTVSLEGEEYLGILSLPTLALELPVGAEWEMDFLRQAPIARRAARLRRTQRTSPAGYGCAGTPGGPGPTLRAIHNISYNQVLIEQID